MRGLWIVVAVLCALAAGCSWARRAGHHERPLHPLAPPTLTAAGHTACLARDGGPVCWGRLMSGRAGPPPGLEHATHVVAAAGTDDDFACGERGDGSVACVGADARLVPIPGLEDAVELAAGGQRLCGRMRDGTVRCAALDGSPRATDVGLSGAVRIAGGDPVCAIQRDGSVMCVEGGGPVRPAFGDFPDTPGKRWRMRDLSANGTLLGGVADDGTPLSDCCGCDEREWWIGHDGPVARLAGGGADYCAVGLDHHVTCAGMSAHGESGVLSIDSVDARISLDAAVTEVALGDGFRCATDGARAWCWGSALDGATGPGTDRRDSVTTIPGAVALSVHTHMICATTRDGGVTCLGSELRAGDRMTRAYASPGVLACSGRIASASITDAGIWVLLDGGVPATGSHCDALVRDAHLRGVTQISGWSGNALTLLDGGVQRHTYYEDWTPLPLPRGVHAVYVGAAFGRDCAVLSDGRVACWQRRRTPPDVLMFTTDTDATEVCVSHGTCVRHADGRVTCTGVLPDDADLSPLTGTTQLGCDDDTVCGLHGDDVVCVSTDAQLSPVLTPRLVALR